MAVSEQLPIVSYTANGTANSFPITFDLHDDEALQVLKNKELVSSDKYSTLNGAVVFSTVPLDGDEITLIRDTYLDRETTFQTYDNSFRPEALNWDFDKIWHVLQEQNLVDAKVLARLKDEIEWRRAHDFNYDVLSKVRDLQIFESLKGYLDTIVASSTPNIFGGITAGVVFALDKKSVQTHLDLIVKDFENIRLELNESKQASINALQSFDIKINEEIKRAKDAEELLDKKINAVSGGYIGGYATLDDLKLIIPTELNSVAEVLDDPNHNPNGSPAVFVNGAYYWDGSKWNYGHSDYQDAVDYYDSFNSLTKNSTTYYPFSTRTRNNVIESLVGGHASFLKDYVLNISVDGADPSKYYRIQQMSNPTQESTPNRWVFEVLDKTDFSTKNTSIKTISVVFPIIANQGIRTFTVQSDDLFIAVTVNTNKIPVGNFYSAIPENNSYTFIIDPSCYQYSAVKISDIEAIKKTTKPIQLQNLLSELRNPIQSVCINFIGDSITWGLGASNIGTTTPNNKNINDIRNNATSPTWLNLLRTYLGTSFCTSERFGDSTITENGMGYYTANGTAVLSSELDYFKFKNRVSTKVFSRAEMEKLIGYNTSASSGSYIDLITTLLTSVSETRPTDLMFDFIGESFVVNYAKLAFGDSESATVNVYVNEVLHTTFSVYGSNAAFGQKFTVENLPAGRNQIRISNAGTVAGVVVRIGSITATKKVTVINNGLSGSSTKTWIDNDVIKDAITSSDNYVVMQLGTNDRHQTAKIGNFKNQYITILNQIFALNSKVQIILMSPPAVTQNEDPIETVYKFRIFDVNAAVSQIASLFKYSFISNFEKTNVLKSQGIVFHSDNLHLNDVGQKFVFDNFIDHLLKA